MDGRYLELKEKILKYNPGCDIELLDKAYAMAKKAHEGQLRESGEPYITHPVEVAHILADLELDCTAIIAGLLHDTVEDTNCTFEDIKEQFGDAVATLVDGVTKLDKIPYPRRRSSRLKT